MLGLADGDVVDIVSEWHDGVERRAEAFRVVAYPTAPGRCAAYFPEANVLVPLDSVAEGSRHADVEVGRRPPRAGCRASEVTLRHGRRHTARHLGPL